MRIRYGTQLLFGLVCLAFAVGLMLAETFGWIRPGPLALPLAMVLALSSWHFLRLPDASRAPDRPSGGLLYVPMVLGFLLAAIPIMGTAYHFGPIMKLCGTFLLGSWAILVVWDGIRNRALSRSVFAATEAGNDHGSYRNESV